MSGVVKGVKKVFKKVGKVLKKIAKPLAIAVAVYFTAGLALSAFAPTAGFAATMPGFAGGGFLGTGIGAGATAGTGVFSNVATALGVGGGIQAASAEIAAAQAAGAAASGAVTSGVSIFNTAAQNAAITASTAGPATTGSVVGGGLKKAAASIGEMSFTDKLIMAKVGTDVAGGLFGPTPQEEAEALAIENAKFRGAFYGMEAGQVTSEPSVFNEAPQAPQAPQLPRPSPQAPRPGPEQQQLLDGRAAKESLFPTAKSVPQTAQVTGPGQMKQQIGVPQHISSPASDVRYA